MEYEFNENESINEQAQLSEGDSITIDNNDYEKYSEDEKSAEKDDENEEEGDVDTNIKKRRKDLKQEEQGVTCNPDILYGKKSDSDDFVVIACDGVWECISNEGISDFIYDKFRNDRNVDLGKIISDIFEQRVF